MTKTFNADALCTNLGIAMNLVNPEFAKQYNKEQCEMMFNYNEFGTITNNVFITLKTISFSDTDIRLPITKWFETNLINASEHKTLIANIAQCYFDGVDLFDITNHEPFVTKQSCIDIGSQYDVDDIINGIFGVFVMYNRTDACIYTDTLKAIENSENFTKS